MSRTKPKTVPEKTSGAVPEPSSERALEKGGLYRHYKGMMYRAIDLVRHSETLEELVLYETLYENKLGRLWVRPKAMFLSDIVIDGKTVRRFAPVNDADPSTPS